MADVEGQAIDHARNPIPSDETTPPSTTQFESRKIEASRSSSPTVRPNEFNARQKLSISKRARTNLENVEIDSRPFRYAHLIRRPRALQFYHPQPGDPSQKEQLLKPRSNDN
jgi:hypothetical protein